MSPKIVAFTVLVVVASAYGQTESGQGNFCEGCKSIVSFATRLNGTHRDDHKEAFQRFCELYNPPSTDFQQGPCPTFVEGLFYLIDKMDPVHHCDQIGACDPSGDTPVSLDLLGKVNNGLPPRSSNGVCSFCKSYVEQLKSALDNPKVIDDIRKQLDDLCEYLKIIKEDNECKRIASNYIHQALDFIRSINSTAYCQSIQLCNPVPPNRPQLLLPTLADFKNFGLETNVVIGNKPVDVGIKADRPARRSPNCVLCKTVVKELFHFLRDNHTEADIVEGLDKVCSYVYHDKNKLNQCQEMVTVYAKELIQLLVDETDPDIICILLEECSNKLESSKFDQVDTAPTISEFISMFDSSIQPGSLSSCVECKVFISYIKTSFEDPKSQEELKNYLLNNLCASLEQDIRDSCTKMVEQYAAIFFKAVADDLSPQETCVELRACRRRVPEVLVINNAADARQSVIDQLRDLLPPRVPLVRSESGPFCDQCVEIINQIDQYLATHSIDQDVSVLIDQVCNKLPEGSVRKECVFLVETFGADIADAVATMGSPRELCSRVKLC